MCCIPNIVSQNLIEYRSSYCDVYKFKWEKGKVWLQYSSLLYFAVLFFIKYSLICIGTRKATYSIQ